MVHKENEQPGHLSLIPTLEHKMQNTVQHGHKVTGST